MIEILSKYRLLACILAILLLLESLFPFRVNPNFSTIIKDSNGKILHAYLNNGDKWRLPIESAEITKKLEKAILEKEDRWFYWHIGINPFAIIRATIKNITAGRRTSGASTVTMQVVRLLNPKKRNFSNKIIESWQAIRLEMNYSKKEIFRLYLSLTPYGSNIEGIKSASVLYFQKTPNLLSLAEITTLAIIPNRPNSLRLGIDNAKIVKERNKWLLSYLENGVFTKTEIEDAINEPLTIKRNEAPALAPHICRRLKAENSKLAIIDATIDAEKNIKVEQITKNYINRLGLNIKNAAIMVINNKSHEVEAYLGSADFNNNDDGGQVDGIQAIRSPGSTLKPLLYAQAFDMGIITPKTIINDVPTNFSGFEPENFDQTFHGKVTMEYALANSLNIPAVRTLKELSTTTFIQTLKKANFQAIDLYSSKLGLSLVLGGCGTTLEELTTLFSAFANKGKLIKPKLSKYPILTQIADEQLISEEAAFVITNILSQITRPDLPNNYDYTYHTPKIAWKTGTSFGKKDAWSIGYNAHYTIGVWVGNFSGKGVAELSGANIATPLLFEIFNTLDYNAPANWFREPKKLEKRKVCTESGMVPSTFCTHQILDYYLPGISNTKMCEHLKSVFLNENETLSYCNTCLPNSGFHTKMLQNLAPELLGYYESRHILNASIPPHNSQCKRIFGNNGPKIVFPIDGNSYYIKTGQKLNLSCQTTSDIKEVNWYINDQFLQKAKANEPIFFIPKPGELKISCNDEKGRNTDINIMVVM